MNSLVFILVVLLSPILGALAGYRLKMPVIFSGAGISCSLVIAFFLGVSIDEVLVYHWLWFDGIVLSIAVDKVTLVLVMLVDFVSLMVAIFSSKYMDTDRGKGRYFAFLGFFIFSMIGLLIADHLFVLFLFWELVGLASYLLIGFWYKKQDVPKNARLAFMVNRVADTCLLAGIILLCKAGYSLTISTTDDEWPLLASFLIVLGAFGKSAQLPFSGWLLKAMVGPTPVSALIHAATMVAAGVYLLIRISSALPDMVLNFVAIVGCLTALYAALCAIAQHDIKRILAFSTISQLGYMVLGIGVGATDASLFHLITHAFFKSGLFLGAAAIIYFMHGRSTADDQDMRNMGGLKNEIPWTFRTFLVCGLALAGLPLFSGFLSKEGIVLAAWQFALEKGAWGYLIADISIFVALLTAFYVGRMILLVFFGSSRTTADAPREKESNSFSLPLVVLALLSIWLFFSSNPFSHSSWLISFMNYEASHFDSSLIPFLSILMVFSGLMLAFSFFKPRSKYALNYFNLKDNNSIGGKLLIEGMGLGKMYASFGIGVLRVARVVSFVDRRLLDPFLHFASISVVVGSKVLTLVDRFFVDGPINLIAFLSAFFGKRVSGLSARDAQTQLFWLLVIVILILGFIILF